MVETDSHEPTCADTEPETEMKQRKLAGNGTAASKLEVKLQANGLPASKVRGPSICFSLKSCFFFCCCNCFA